MATVIREATADDYEALCELFDEVAALHRDHLPHFFRKPTRPVREQAYYQGLFLSEVNGNAVGFVHAVIRDAPALPIFIPRRYAVVDNLGVKSDFRGGGIGWRLMQRIHDWAIVKGASAIELNVHAFNRGAISFYRKLGYKTVSQRMTQSLD